MDDALNEMVSTEGEEEVLQNTESTEPYVEEEPQESPSETYQESYVEDYYIPESQNSLVGEEFAATMEELIALEEAQLDAMQHMYAGQIFCIGVLGAILVCSLLYSAINKFL